MSNGYCAVKKGSPVLPCAKAPGELLVTVNNRSDLTPLRGATVKLSGPASHTASTDQNGHASFSKLPPGNYKITATLKTYSTELGAATVQSTAKTQSTLALNPTVHPSIVPAHQAVMVKKAYTKPGRKLIQLKTNIAFAGTGTFTRSSNSVRFFTAAAGGKEITFNLTDNVFTGAQLGAGVSLYAEGAKGSAKVDDVELKLTLTGPMVGLPAKSKMTAVEVTLDICEPRTAAGANPPPLPSAPAPPAHGVASTDKFYLGRPVPVDPDWDTARPSERAMLIIRPVKPAGFTGKLVLAANNKNIDLYNDETPKKGESPIKVPHTINAAAGGLKLFVQGTKPSASARETELRLGIDGLEPDGDRVSITAVYVEAVSNVEAKNLKTVSVVPEKPERKSKSKFLPAPLIMGLKYDVEIRPYAELAKISAYQWSSASPHITLADASKEVLKVHGNSLSSKLNDITIDLLLTTDVGKFKKRHHLTVVKADINPVIKGDKLKHTDDINRIKNPSGIVILTGADASNAKLVPKFEITKIKPDLGWKPDDDRIAWRIIGGEAPVAGTAKYEGKADFLNDEKAKRGTTVQIFGSQTGDVLIEPYSGGYAYGMFRANVVPLKKIKYRVNRIFIKASPAFKARAPKASHDDAKKHIKVMNLYLRTAGIELTPDNSAEMASSAGNAKIGQAGLDPKVVAVTKVADGHFDVEVNDRNLTFKAPKSDAIDAIRINARNEIVCFAYINSETSSKDLATAYLCPANHAPLARANPPRAYTTASYTLPDSGVPSSSLIPKTGFPGDTPVGTVKMIVLDADVSWQGSSPTTRDVDLLWGISVPTTSIQKSKSAKGGDSTILAYGNTLAHEVGHILGLGHRGDLSDPNPDGLALPTNENLMHPTEIPPTAQNLDIIQVKAIRFSEALFRSP